MGFAAENPPEYLLQADVRAGQTRRVMCVLEVQGELKLNADGKQVTNLPLKVRGDLGYTERVLEFDREGGVRRDARYYQKAQAAMQIGESNRLSVLPGDHRLIVAHAASRLRLFSPLGPLRREELELVTAQGDTALLYRLLPEVKTRVGAQWQHDNQLVADLFGLDVVHTNRLSSTLRRVSKNIAVVDLAGEASGAVAGVSSDLEVEAIYNFHLAERRITWFTAKIDEDRAIGHAEPGFKVNARLRVATKAADDIAELSHDSLSELRLEADSGSTLLEFQSHEGGFRILHDRQWQLMVDRFDVSILRRVDQGDLIAQCNISALADLEPGQHLQIESFQADIERALGERFGQFVEASQATTDTGLQVLRTVVSGAVSDLPIHWTYYHFSDDAGRQVSLVFTMGAELVERFAESDAVIASSFSFRPRAEPGATPEPGRQATAAEPPKDATRR